MVPPPIDSGDLGQTASNQLAIQASYPHSNDINMDCEGNDEETRGETVDFNTYEDKLTATSNNGAKASNPLEAIVRNIFLPEAQIHAIKQEIDQTVPTTIMSARVGKTATEMRANTKVEIMRQRKTRIQN